MSMLSWFNSSDATSFGGPQWRVYQKLNQVQDPGPSLTMIFLDERADSINDGEWCSSMTGWPDQPGAWKIVDFPASYHGGSGGTSFVDGHAEIHKWRDPRTTPPDGKVGALNIPSPNNQDVYWMMEHSTRKK
jgi:prepilin-type processing-associated H-X9-DG protein